MLKKWILKYNTVINSIALALPLLTSSLSYAISPLPGSVEPGRVEQNYLPPPISPPSLPTPIKQQEEKAPGLGAEAEKIKFKLNNIILEGNHVYTTKQLLPIYQDKLKKEITIGQLQDIRQNITNYYRNNGYITSRAILPPQHVVDGIVRIRVIEGYVDKVQILGNARGARWLLQSYGQNIADKRPLQIKNMEHNLYLANAIPGTQVRAVLEPSKTEVGASDLNLVVQQQLVNAYISYDNYGTFYLGPHQLTGNVSVNSIFRSGDTTRFTYLTTTQAKELRYGDISYMTPLGISGLQVTLDGNKSLTIPGFVLAPFDTKGQANTYSIVFSYPLILSTEQNLTLDGGFTYLDSQSTQFGFLLYKDHIRPIQVGGTYNFSDKYAGSNVWVAHLTQGFNIFGASNDPRSFFTSRFGADAIFTKWNAQAARTQALYKRFSAFFVAQGQYSYSPVLSSAQFGFGGSQIGRGYDPAEILGDRGVAGSMELRMNTYPEMFYVQAVQFYIFYDIGKIWNIQNLPGVVPEISASSTGLGARFSVTPYLSGNVMFTQPLTKQVAAEELIGRGRNPRTFFSIVASI